MGICYIIGAGDCSKLDFKKEKQDYVIAADGGYKHLLSANIVPDILIGDFDSLKTVPQDIEIIKLNPVKDLTDMNFATEFGIEKGYAEFVLFGALGGRIDHSLANIQLLAQLSKKGMKASIRDGNAVITAVTNGKVTFDSSFKGYVSVFAHSDVCENVNIKGLKYSLKNAALKNSFSLGVSNEFIGTNSEIEIGSGTAIIVYYI